MYYVCAGAAIFLWIPVIVLRSYEKEWFRKYIKIRSPLALLYPMGLWCYERMSEGRKKNGKNQEFTWGEAVYVRDQPQIKLRLAGAKRCISLWLCMEAGLLLAFAVSFLSEPSESMDSMSLTRPEFGEVAEFDIMVQGSLNEETVTDSLTVSVDGRQPYEDEMMEIFDQAFEHVKVQVEEGHESLEAIRSNLTLLGTTDYGIRVEWTSLNPEYINDWGEIQIKEIPEEGVIAGLTATLTYSSYEAAYTLNVKLLPPEKDAAYYMGLLSDSVFKAEEEMREGEEIILPGTLGDMRFKYQMKETPYVVYILIMTPVIGLFFYMFSRNRLKKMYEDRNAQMERDYIILVSKINMLVRAGLTVKNAWDRMVSEYQGRLKRGGENRYLYEEMTVTVNQIKGGINEGMAYREFGYRCGGYAYIKFGNLLEQHLRQGISGISIILEQEMHQALVERQNKALRAGEIIGTKLMLPMLLLLGVVMAVLIVPAFMSMQL